MKKKKNKIAVYAFEGNLDINFIDQAFEKVKQTLLEASEFHFDLANVMVITAPGAQLILSIINYANEKQLKIKLVNLQTEAKENLISLGLSEKLLMCEE